MPISGELSNFDPGTISAETALTVFRQIHSNQLMLCDGLEAIADSFPDDVQRETCMFAAEAMEMLLPLHHSLEEDILFPALLKKETNDPALRGTLARLTGEHRTDEGYCAEAVELLKPLAAGEPPQNAEADGYLLRGLFESWRRHIAFEDEYILPRAEALLQNDELRGLAVALKSQLKDKVGAKSRSNQKRLF